jgi:hypothetical protein
MCHGCTMPAENPQAAATEWSHPKGGPRGGRAAN